jgi:hypothetical protein
MPAINHHFILHEKEPLVPYRVLVEARQIKELEYDETRNLFVLEEIEQLRKLIDRVFRLMGTDTASPSMN